MNTPKFNNKRMVHWIFYVLLLYILDYIAFGFKQALRTMASRRKMLELRDFCFTDVIKASRTTRECIHSMISKQKVYGGGDKRGKR